MYIRNGETVVLTVTLDEFSVLVTALGSATAYAHQEGDWLMVRAYVELMNSLNKGNQGYTPFEVPTA